MVPKHAILGLIKACASCVGVAKGAMDGDDSAIGVSVGGAVQALFVGIAKDFAGELGKALIDVTQPLEYAVALVSCLEWVNGFGTPDKGPALKETAPSYFENARQYIEEAYGEEDLWGGQAAEEYRVLNKKLEKCIIDLKAADKELAGLISEEAAAVVTIRQNFVYIRMSLLLAIPVIWAEYLALYAGLMCNPFTASSAEPVAKITAQVSQGIIVAAAFGTLAGITGVYMNETMPEIAGKVRGMGAGKYADARTLAAQAVATPTVRRQSVRAGTPLKVSGFPIITGSGTFSGGSSGSYPVAGGGSRRAAGARSYPVAGAASYPVAGAPRALGDAATDGADKDVQPAPPVKPPTPAPAEPAAAASPITPATIAAANTLAQTVSQVIQSTFSQATGAIKPAASAPGAKGAPDVPGPPAPPEAAAAEGAEGGERAPIDAAAGQGQEARRDQSSPRSTPARPAP